MANEERERPAGHDFDRPQGWRVVAAASLCLAVGPSALLVACFGVLLGPTVQRYGWSPAQIGGAASAMTFAIMFASILQGVLVDRHGVRRVVLTSIPLLSAGMLAMHWLPRNLGLLYLAWFILPLLAVGLWPGSYLKAVSGWFDRHLGLATGLTNAGIGIGTIAGPALVAWAARTHGLPSAWLVMAGLAFLAFPIAWLALRERVPHRPPASAGEQAGSLGEIFRMSRYRVVMFSFLLLGVTGTGLVASIVPILTSKGLSLSAAVGAFAAFGVMGLTGRIVSGWMLDRLHVTQVLYILGVTTFAGLVTIVLTDSVWMLVAATALLGLMSGGEFDVLAYTLRRYFGLRSFGRMYGFAFSAFQLGATGGAALLATSVGRTGSYAVALAIFALAVVASMILFSRIGPYPQREALPG
jgi:predicted MFS family arabinose efflux permease